MRNKYLLGATSNNELAFGEFEITYRNGHAEFTASFFTVRPFNGDNIDLEEYYEDWSESLGKEYMYDMCKEFDCKPSELAKCLADDCYDIRDAMDCSLYPECCLIDGNSWYFESIGCGQHDTRDEMEEIINPDAYNLLHKLWDKYHLKKVDDDVISQVEKLHKMLSDIDEEEWIMDYIERHMDELEV